MPFVRMLLALIHPGKQTEQNRTDRADARIICNVPIDLIYNSVAR